MRAPTTLAYLDDLTVDAESSGRHAQLAERLLGTADRMPHGTGSLRAEVLVAAAEQLHLSEQPDRAVVAARAAVADGGKVRHGAPVHLAAALRIANQPTEARALLAEIRRSRPTEPGLHLFAGEQCEGLGDETEALRWYARGLSIAEGRRHGDERFMCILLLIARAGLRGRLGLPPDDWDEDAEGFIQDAERSLAMVHRDETTQPTGDTPCSLAAVISRADDATLVDLVHV